MSRLIDWTSPLLGWTGWSRKRRNRKKAAAMAKEQARQEVFGMEDNYGFNLDVDGFNAGTAGFKDGKFELGVNRSEAERDAFDTATEGYGNALNALNDFDVEGIGDRAEQAYRTKALTNFNNQWNPMVDKLQESIGQRFGTLNTSGFNDNFSNMVQSNYIPAMQGIENEAILQRGNLIQSEMNPFVNLFNTFGVALDRDSQNISNRIAMTSQGYNQGQDSMRTSQRFQDAVKRAGLGASNTAPRQTINVGQILAGLASGVSSAMAKK
jgi:hypothetical protein